jgi:hypothetical protein
MQSLESNPIVHTTPPPLDCRPYPVFTIELPQITEIKKNANDKLRYHTHVLIGDRLVKIHAKSDLALSAQATAAPQLEVEVENLMTRIDRITSELVSSAPSPIEATAPRPESLAKLLSRKMIVRWVNAENDESQPELEDISKQIFEDASSTVQKVFDCMEDETIDHEVSFRA